MALIHATKHGKIEDVRACLNQGMPVDGSGDDWSPLMWAAFYGHQDVAQVLLDNGANIDFVFYQDNKNAIDCASANDQTAFLEFLQKFPSKGKPTLTPHKSTMSAINADVLVHGCKYGKVDDVRVCLEEGIEADGQGNEWTPFMWAAYYGHIDVAKVLVEFGADTDHVCYYDGKDATDAAKENNQNEFLEYLKTLPLKGKPAPPPHKSTMSAIYADVLIHGCKYGKVDDVRMCLKKGIEADGQGNEWSPFMWAAYYGHIDVAKVLVEFGADPDLVFYQDVCYHDGEDAMDVAKQNNQNEFVEYLKTLQGKPAPPPHKSTMSAISADVLIHGCKYGKVDDVRVCLEEGIEADGQGNEWSPFMWAAYYGHIDVAKVLVEFGADPDHVFNHDGKDATDAAKENNQNEFLEYLKTLPLKGKPALLTLNGQENSSYLGEATVCRVGTSGGVMDTASSILPSRVASSTSQEKDTSGSHDVSTTQTQPKGTKAPKACCVIQ